MNEDFENRLQSLRPGSLPESWRGDILAAARAAETPRTGPPRWLALGWGLAWAATVVLYLATPAESPVQVTHRGPALQPALREREETLHALLAFTNDSPPAIP